MWGKKPWLWLPILPHTHSSNDSKYISLNEYTIHICIHWRFKWKNKQQIVSTMKNKELWTEYMPERKLQRESEQKAAIIPYLLVSMRFKVGICWKFDTIRLNDSHVVHIFMNFTTLILPKWNVFSNIPEFFLYFHWIFYTFIHLSIKSFSFIQSIFAEGTNTDTFHPHR